MNDAPTIKLCKNVTTKKLFLVEESLKKSYSSYLEIEIELRKMIRRLIAKEINYSLHNIICISVRLTMNGKRVWKEKSVLDV